MHTAILSTETYSLLIHMTIRTLTEISTFFFDKISKSLFFYNILNKHYAYLTIYTFKNPIRDNFYWELLFSKRDSIFFKDKYFTF